MGREQVEGQPAPAHGTMSISVGGVGKFDFNKKLLEKYPNITGYLSYIASESPSVKSQLQKGQVSDALLSTLETVQSAYVAPSVSGIGPAKQMLTEWWFNPIWGQPRLVDLRTVKQLARGHIGSMAVEAILDQIMQVSWDVIPKFRTQVDRPPQTKAIEREQTAQVESFLEMPNRNKDSFNKLLRMFIRNILETDDGTMVKVFEEYERPDTPNVQSASTSDIRAYTAQPAWDQVPKKGSPLIEIYAEDGSSFLKQVDMHGYLMNYWQYSFVVPRRPVRFETSEILYVMQNPRAGSPYGYSPFESLVDTLNFIAKAQLYNEHFYENSAIPALQIDYPWIKDTNTLEEMGRYIENTFLGPDKAFRTLVTNQGTTVNTINWNPQQLQMLEMQDFYIRLAMAKLKVPPMIVGLTGGATGQGGGGGSASAPVQQAVHKSRAIKPLIGLVEDALNAQLIPDICGVGIEDCYVQFKWGEMVDVEEQERQAHVDQVYLSSGKVTINELRLRDGQDPVSYGDLPFLPQAKFPPSLFPQQAGGWMGGTSGGGSTSSMPMPSSQEGKGESGAPTTDQYSTVSQSRMPRSIGATPREGRGYGSIPGGEFKNLEKSADDDAIRIGRALQDILKEAYDNMKDRPKDTDKILQVAVDKADTAIEYHLTKDGPAAKKEASRNFRRILSDMAVEIRDGKL